MTQFKSYEDYRDWAEAVARTTERSLDEVESEAGHTWPMDEATIEKFGAGETKHGVKQHAI